MRLIKLLKTKKLILLNIFLTLYVGTNLIGGERGLISYFEKKNLEMKLSEKKVKLNVTAIMTSKQVEEIMPSLKESHGAFISIFAGRIADAGIDPLNTMVDSLKLLEQNNNLEMIWASPRELYNVVQANEIGCHVITATSDILNKLPTLGKDLNEFSLETVKMFYQDALEAGYKI